MSLEDFCILMGIGKTDSALYEKMEMLFLDHVHGQNQKYIYGRRYQKISTDLKSVDTLVKKIDYLQEEHGKKDAIMSDQQKEIEGLRLEIKTRDDLVAEQQRLIAEQNGKLQGIYGSLSWKITKPVRVLSRMIKK